ncbi:BlaI/MecI/CopY family transcriptional regulator [Hyphobacterium sp.]|uniref:BlaI/MecI/CopY family transcriptional regulator n=1 Tax=Hyphobacterium sp. TaxID=2004662 RepID=UPI00374A11F8
MACYGCNVCDICNVDVTGRMSSAPSNTELTILKHLWTTGPQSAREVQDAIGKQTGWSYSTTRTLLLRMTEKKIVRRQDSHGLAVFAANVSKVALMGELIRGFAANILDIDGPISATAFTSSKLFSEEEAAELTRLLEEVPNEEGE